MASQKYKQYSVLASSTLAFTVCFMVWMMLAVVGIPVKEQLGLSETEFGILAATPVLSGSLVRVPLPHVNDLSWWRPVRQSSSHEARQSSRHLDISQTSFVSFLNAALCQPCS